MSSASQSHSGNVDSIKKRGTLSPATEAKSLSPEDVDQMYGQPILVTHHTPVEGQTDDRETPAIGSRRTPHDPQDPQEIRRTSVFLPGNRLVDRYEVIQKIGEGGMSLVYEAFDEVRNEHVALKILLPHLADKPKIQQRFLQEGRLSSSFSHANIARVYDLHQTESVIMLSMELLRGSTLRTDMERRKDQRQRYLPCEVLAVIRQVSQALGVVHASNVIHRDLKPENLWMSNDKIIKVMDFGIARDSMKIAYTIGPHGSGTPFYSAPEQLMASATLDQRADQYSLAVIAYEMLTGELPHGAIQAPHLLNPKVTRKLSLAIIRAMNSDPSKRFPDIHAFSEAAHAKTRRSPWLRAGALLGGMTLVVASALGVQHGLLPLLQSEPSPIWASIPTQEIMENEEVSFVVRHPDATLTSETLTFKLPAEAPRGTSIDAATGKFYWTPDESQGPKDYHFKISAIVQQKGMPPVTEEQSISISVDERYDAPEMDTLEARSAKEHTPFKILLAAQDPNIPAIGLHYELLAGPAGMTIDERTGMLQWTPLESDGGTNQKAEVRVALSSDDHSDSTITRTLNIRVEESIDAPRFTSPNRIQATVGEAAKFHITSRDPNTPAINRFYRLRNGDEFGMSVDPQTGELHWTPTEEHAGREFELTAEIGWDGAGKSELLAEQTIHVTVAELKQPASTEDEKIESIADAKTEMPIETDILENADKIAQAALENSFTEETGLAKSSSELEPQALAALEAAANSTPELESATEETIEEVLEDILPEKMVAVPVNAINASSSEVPEVVEVLPVIPISNPISNTFDSAQAPAPASPTCNKSSSAGSLTSSKPVVIQPHTIPVQTKPTYPHFPIPSTSVPGAVPTQNGHWSPPHGYNNHPSHANHHPLPSQQPSWPPVMNGSNTPSKFQQPSRVGDVIKQSIQQEIKSHIPKAFRPGNHR